MKSETFKFKDQKGTNIFVYQWVPKAKPKGVVQIFHGMAEHSFRYERFAKALTDKGYIVYSSDYRGHGKTAGSVINLGSLGTRDGLNLLVQDEYELMQLIKKDFPKLPYYIFSHSMGSFLAQEYISRYGKEIDGVILSGSAGPYGPILYLGMFFSFILKTIKGNLHYSRFLYLLTFGSYNASFLPLRTKYDWLSRDTAEVDKYKNDPYCGFYFTDLFFYDFYTFLNNLHKQEKLDKIPKKLPIFIIAGQMDPVSNKTLTLQKLLDIYSDNSIRNVEYKFYPGARHELLNETNRGEITEDIINWLEKNRKESK
jgi:alpha-beta hydrolase superfamily lysophospholipase